MVNETALGAARAKSPRNKMLIIWPGTGLLRMGILMGVERKSLVSPKKKEDGCISRGRAH